jgi:hypothetical protein
MKAYMHDIQIDISKNCQGAQDALYKRLRCYIIPEHLKYISRLLHFITGILSQHL